MRGIPERPDAERQLRAGQRLAWLSIAYICSTVALLFMVMGGSQALKTEFVEDALSFLPPAFFLISDKISRREPNRRFPFGYERVVSAAYVGSAVALLAVGLLLLFDGGMKLAMAEHPTIGGFPIFGHVVWTGWLAIPVLLWCAIPAHFLGRAKRKAAGILYDKTLASDAAMNEANWQSAGAAILGIVGVAFGLWWADSLAAVLISLEIIRSGWHELRTAVGRRHRSKSEDGRRKGGRPDRRADHRLPSETALGEGRRRTGPRARPRAHGRRSHRADNRPDLRRGGVADRRTRLQDRSAPHRGDYRSGRGAAE